VRILAATAALGALLVLGACGGSDDVATSTAGPATTITETVTVAPDEPPLGEYPREVSLATLDPRIQMQLVTEPGAEPVGVVVQLAPGVYAPRGEGALGTDVDDYTSIAGWCSDVNRWAEVHEWSSKNCA
jgi:hypothetical protein